MILDCYTMAGGYFIRQDSMGFPQLFEAMERTGVAAAAVMSTRALQADARKGNEHLMSVASGDRRVIPIAVVYPEADHYRLPQTIADSVDRGAAGLGFYMNQAFSSSSLVFRQSIAEAVKPGLPVFFVDVRDAGVLSQIAELTAESGCPAVFLGPHYVNFGELLAVLAAYPHTYAETSWQITPGCIELLVEAAGPDRVLFGSGAPIRPIQPALNMVLDAEIDDGVKRKILAANALRLFGKGLEASRVEASSAPLPEPKAPRTPAVDVHGHLGVAPRLPMKIRDVDAIEYYAARANIEVVVCSAPVAYREDIEGGNQEMLRKIEGRPRLRGSPTISPTHMDESIHWLDAAAAHPKLVHATWDPDNEGEAIGVERFMTLWAEVAKRGIPVFWNSGSQDLDRNVRWQKKLGYMPMIRGASKAESDMFLQVGRRHPDLPIILGHGLGEDGVAIAKRTRNIYLELSGTYPEREALRNAIDALGPERIVYGTDMDLINPAFGLGVYYEADMSPEEDSLVMAGNARRILGLTQETG